MAKCTIFKHSQGPKVLLASEGTEGLHGLMCTHLSSSEARLTTLKSTNSGQILDWMLGLLALESEQMECED